MTSSIQWAYQRVQHFYSAPLGGTRDGSEPKDFFYGLTLYMETPGDQNPTFWPKMTPNIGIIQRIFVVTPLPNVLQLI